MSRWQISREEEKCPMCGSILEMRVEARNGSRRPSAERCPHCGYRQALVRMGGCVIIEKWPPA